MSSSVLAADLWTHLTDVLEEWCHCQGQSAKGKKDTGEKTHAAALVNPRSSGCLMYIFNKGHPK